MASNETLEKEAAGEAPETTGAEQVEEVRTPEAEEEAKQEDQEKRKPGGGPAPAAAEEGEEEVKEEECEDDEAKPEKGAGRGAGGKRGRGRKRGRPSLQESTPKKKVAKDEEGGSEKTPVKTSEKKRKRVVMESVERPSRERKTVERYAAISPKKSPAPKVVAIQQGPGATLKDIPNVLFKLNKRKTDENLQLLHAILFGKKGKARIVKKNIFQFSGFVWTDEEKQRAKIRERLDKCAKDKLLDFCDLLDLSSTKSTMRKEELSAKLFEFLESPCVTRDVLLSEKKSKKRRRSRASSKSSEKVKRGRKPKSQSEEDKEEEHDSDPADEKDGSSDDTDGPKDNSDADIGAESAGESESENEDEKPSPAVKRSLDKKPKKGKSKDVEEKALEKPDSSVKPSKSARSKQDVSKEAPKKLPRTPKEKTPAKKVSSKSGSVSVPKDEKIKNKKAQQSSPLKKQSKKQAATPGKSPKGKSETLQPTREEMHAVVSNILKEVDFNTATLADILRQLGSHFKTDLISRKAEIKGIIEDVINSMTTDDEDDEGDEEEGDAKMEDADKEKKEDDDSKDDDDDEGA